MGEKFSKNEIINEVDDFEKDMVIRIISEYVAGTTQGITTEELNEYLKRKIRKD